MCHSSPPSKVLPLVAWLAVVPPFRSSLELSSWPLAPTLCHTVRPCSPVGGVIPEPGPWGHVSQGLLATPPVTPCQAPPGLSQTVSTHRWSKHSNSVYSCGQKSEIGRAGLASLGLESGGCPGPSHCWWLQLSPIPIPQSQPPYSHGFLAAFAPHLPEVTCHWI